MSISPTERPPRVALVAMPWSQAARPSAALGVLGAFVERELPQLRVARIYAYLDVAAALGLRLYDLFAEHCYAIGEMAYLPQLYAARRDDVVGHIAAELAVASRTIQASSALPENVVTVQPSELMEGRSTWRDVAERTDELLCQHVEQLADALVAAKYSVIGFTTCFGQVFPNIALARAVKRRAPEVIIVFGGSSVSSRVGASLLCEFDCIDYVIQGEGERPLSELLRCVSCGQLPAFDKGLLTRELAHSQPGGVPLWEVGRLDDLPLPNYDDYAAHARALGLSWELPIEGSRGCWWDRIKKTGDPKDTCYFCNLNVQWNGYRQKSEARVVEEVRVLGDRYANGRIYFLDNIIRHHGAEQLADGLKSLDRDLDFFYELRANVTPSELVSLWEAGLRRVQVGVEALSTSMLKRIGKGTTAIQNLQIMKTLFELGISNNSNLMIDFPTTTTAEVSETVATIERFALPYQPLELTFFELRIGTTTDIWRDKFGLSNVQNPKTYATALPTDVGSRLSFMTGLDYECAGVTADWSPVVAAVESWRRKHAETKRRADPLLLSYEDGGTYLRLRDRRHEACDHVLRENDRLLYLACTQIRSIGEVTTALAWNTGRQAGDPTTALAPDAWNTGRQAGDPRTALAPDAWNTGRQAGDRSRACDEASRLCDLIDRLVDRDLMFREGDRVLSLATARSAQAAAQRIRRVAAMMTREPQRQRTLPLLRLAVR